jgi:hypothetical protein
MPGCESDAQNFNHLLPRAALFSVCKERSKLRLELLQIIPFSQGKNFQKVFRRAEHWHNPSKLWHRNLPEKKRDDRRRFW